MVSAFNAPITLSEVNVIPACVVVFISVFIHRLSQFSMMNAPCSP